MERSDSEIVITIIFYFIYESSVLKIEKVIKSMGYWVVDLLVELLSKWSNYMSKLN